MSVTLPSLDRYRALKVEMKNGLILRPMQYEALERADTSGVLLDIGGGNNSDYRRLLKCERYDSINIDPRIEPTWVLKVGERFPIDPGSYDVALSMNTFEHVFDTALLMEEIAKALKPGGRFVASTPFLYRIHAHPYDYYRPTGTWWEDTLGKYGFGNVAIQPLTWGPHSTALCARGISGAFKGIRSELAILQDLLYTRLRKGRADSLQQQLATIPVGYFVTAAKR